MAAYVIDEKAIQNNIRLLKEHAKCDTIWGVIKGNGYGFGVTRMAGILKDSGIDHFAISDVYEAVELRKAGFTDEKILMLRGTGNKDEAEELLKLGVILTIGSLADLEAAKSCSISGEAHIKIDAGFGRFGFMPNELDNICTCFNDPSIKITGIFTHFPRTYAVESTKANLRDFCNVVSALKEKGLDPGMVHCCSSADFWSQTHMHFDAVRLGSALLGRIGYGNSVGLKNVGYCLARISAIRELPAGHSIGYGEAYRTKKDAKIAILDIGHINGFGYEVAQDTYRFKDYLHSVLRPIKKLLKKDGYYVTLNGKRCPVVGHISMCVTAIDVTDCPCKVGDCAEVTLNPLQIKNLPIISASTLKG